MLAPVQAAPICRRGNERRFFVSYWHERKGARLKGRGRERFDRGNFTQASHEETLTIKNLREDVQKALGGSGLFCSGKESIQWQELDLVRILRFQPQADRFIFVAIEGTGGVNQRTARSQGVKRAGNELTLGRRDRLVTLY